MKREELRKAYAELQRAIQKARGKGRRKAQRRIKLSVEAARAISEYVFDPECAFDEFEEDDDE